MNLKDLKNVEFITKNRLIYVNFGGNIDFTMKECSSGFKVNEDKTFFEDKDGNVFLLKGEKLIVGCIDISNFNVAYFRFINTKHY